MWQTSPWPGEAFRFSLFFFLFALATFRLEGLVRRVRAHLDIRGIRLWRGGAWTAQAGRKRAFLFFFSFSFFFSRFLRLCACLAHRYPQNVVSGPAAAAATGSDRAAAGHSAGSKRKQGSQPRTSEAGPLAHQRPPTGLSPRHSARASLRQNMSAYSQSLAKTAL